MRFGAFVCVLLETFWASGVQSPARRVEESGEKMMR